MSMGKAYEYMEHDMPTYPTLWQRIVVWVKNLFTREPPVVSDEGINLRALTCDGQSSTVNVLELLAAEGLEPTIERTTDKWQGWYAKVTDTRSKKDPRGGVKWVGGNFLKVASCHTVRYYDLTWSENSLYNNPFYNVERIISMVGERDDIHKKTKRKASAAKAA
mgnify:CR=1 FL=1